MRYAQPKLKTKDLDQLLHDSLWAVTCQEKSYGPKIALSMLEDYFQAAIKQHSRLARQEKAIKALFLKANWNKRPMNLSQSFRDIHFYLISWVMIIKLSKKLRQFKENGTKQKLFPQIKQILKQYKSTHNDYKYARDYLEHIDERLPGDEKRKKMSKPNELSCLYGTVLSLGGHKIDIGKTSLKTLRSFVAELKQALLNDCCEYLKNHSPSDLDRIIRRWQKDRDTQRLTRKVTKDLRKLGVAV